jgi:hypothetical protein
MRKAKPWWRESRGQWCVYFRGKLVVLALGKGKRKEATHAWHQLMADAKVNPPETITLKQLLHRYEQAHQHKHSPRTTANRKSGLASILKAFGSRKAQDLSPAIVETWIAKHPLWGKTMSGLTLATFRRLFDGQNAKG